ncbi:hypothetical protein [Tsukamurella tyrosinosolvens]|uniref:hypothetical protein n=1 Tax=Tsukamurella tyrosinosolvens TaxID=57704 RepID=UPI002DD43F6C|nr:hypothetical protein [Tsukamurella tyrosinosolvens]MEC4611664.1 hypothetical protein [Tsukamurella tyrosinosolvens]
MDTSDLERAVREYAAVLSEAAEADLAAPVGERTVGGLTGELAARASALAGALGAAAGPDGAPGPPDSYGGGFDLPFRRALRRLAAAAGAAPSDPGTECELADLTGAVEDGAGALTRALGLG